MKYLVAIPVLAMSVTSYAAPPDNEKVGMGVSYHFAQLDTYTYSTDPVVELQRTSERYSYLEVASSNPSKIAVMSVPVPNVNDGDILQVEGALQVHNELHYAVELTCSIIYSPSRGSNDWMNRTTQTPLPVSGLIAKEHGYNVTPQDSIITSGTDEYRPMWAKSTSNNQDPTIATQTTNSRFAGMHHGIFPFAASIKIDNTQMTSQDLYVELVCYAGGSSETVSGDRLDIAYGTGSTYSSHMNVLHHYPVD